MRKTRKYQTNTNMYGTNVDKRSFHEVDYTDTTDVVYSTKTHISNLYDRIAEQSHVISNLRYEVTKADKIYTDLLENSDTIVNEKVKCFMLKTNKMIEARDISRDEKMRVYFKAQDDTIVSDMRNKYTMMYTKAHHRVKFLTEANEEKDLRIIKLENDIKTLTHKKKKKRISTSSSLNTQ